jgi:hypothetical protein
MLALTTGNPVYLISTKGARWVWPVSRGCLLILSTWSYLRICRRSMLPYTRFCNCLLDYDYVLHIVNFAILYFLSLCSNIPLSSADGVYISHFIRYARAWFTYENFSKWDKLLTNKFVLQGYNDSRLKSIFANSTVAIMTLFAITNHHWSIFWMICFIQYVWLWFSYWRWRRVIPYT